jgi:hypothetical protein
MFQQTGSVSRTGCADRSDKAPLRSSRKYSEATGGILIMKMRDVLVFILLPYKFPKTMPGVKAESVKKIIFLLMMTESICIFS